MASLFLIGSKQIHKYVNTYVSQNVIVHNTTENRGRGSARCKEKGRKLKLRHLAAIAAYVDKNNEAKGGMTSVKMIQSHMFQQFDGMEIADSTLRYALKVRLGYSFSTPENLTVRMTAARKARIRRYLIQYDKALKAEAAGTAIIVYMDESYVHQNHFPARCWHKKGKDVVRPRGKGKRLIIVHAVTKDGLLFHAWTVARPSHC